MDLAVPLVNDHHVPTTNPASGTTRTMPQGFPFLSLPSDLRQLIYHLLYAASPSNPAPRLYVYIMEVLCPPSHISRGCLSVRADIQHYLDPSLINFQFTNKQIYAEVNPVYYQNLLVDLDVNHDAGERFWSLVSRETNSRFRERVQWMTFNDQDTNVFEHFPNLQGIVFNNLQMFHPIPSVEEFLEVTRDGDDDIPWMRHIGKQSVAHGIEKCWFRVRHNWIARQERKRPIADGADGKDGEGYCTSTSASTIVRYIPEIKELEMSQRLEEVNRKSNPTLREEDMTKWPGDGKWPLATLS